MQISNMCLLFSYLAYLLRYGHLNTPRTDNKILHFEYYNHSLSSFFMAVTLLSNVTVNLCQ